MSTITLRLYCADVRSLEDSALYRRLYRALSDGRREKVDCVRPQKGKLLSLGAGALLEASLAELGVFSPRLAEGPNGKPYLPDRPDLYFNISHSGSKVLCAVSGREVGCDVERVREAKLQVARRCFHPAEYETLMGCSDSAARDRLFYRFWTLKESFMKVTGYGFQLPPDRFCIQIEGKAISVMQNVDAQRYFFRSFSAEDYEYALCSPARIPQRLCLTERSFPELAERLHTGG